MTTPARRLLARLARRRAPRGSARRRIGSAVRMFAALALVGGVYAAFTPTASAQDTPSLSAAAQTGKALFDQSCITCHGQNAQGDFVDQAGFEALLSAKGIANDDTVVLYGGNNNWFASYAYWYFKLYGHDAVKLLDGGRKKWELDSRDLVAAVPERAATE